MTAVEDYECKPQVREERWPRVLDNGKTHFTCGLTAIETDMSTSSQIWVLENGIYNDLLSNF